MSEEGFLRQVRWYPEEWSLTDLCEWLFPAISDGMKKIYDKYSSGLRPLINADGNVVGRAVMCGHMFGRKTDGPGVVTTNGIRVESIRGLLGIVSNGYYYWGLRERRGGRPAWPPVPDRFIGYSVEGENYSPLWFALVEAIADSWNESFDAVMSASSIRTENAAERVRIGTRGQQV